jgi:putative oxidoreductase
MGDSAIPESRVSISQENLLAFVRDTFMQRLFSSFASGWPGTGLLLMRVVVGIAVIDCGVVRLWGDPATILLSVLSVLEIGAGFLLLAGLWTPIAGTLVVGLEVWKIFLTHGNPWIYVPLGTLGAALAMLGPGAYSIDARLFGRKHIDIREG